MYVYIDESGNLGFSLKSTQFFVVAYLTLEHPFEMGKAMKRQLKRLHKRRKYARGYNELKYSESRDAVKQKVLRKICQCDVKIGFVVLEKAKVVPQLKENPTILYNYLIVDKVMRAVLPSVDSNDKLNIIVDKSLPRSSREAFNIYARNKASWLLTIWDKENPKEMRHYFNDKVYNQLSHQLAWLTWTEVNDILSQIQFQNAVEELFRQETVEYIDRKIQIYKEMGRI